MNLTVTWQCSSWKYHSQPLSVCMSSHEREHTPAALILLAWDGSATAGTLAGCLVPAVCVWNRFISWPNSKKKKKTQYSTNESVCVCVCVCIFTTLLLVQKTKTTSCLRRWGVYATIKYSVSNIWGNSIEHCWNMVETSATTYFWSPVNQKVAWSHSDFQQNWK